MLAKGRIALDINRYATPSRLSERKEIARIAGLDCQIQAKTGQKLAGIARFGNLAKPKDNFSGFSDNLLGKAPRTARAAESVDRWSNPGDNNSPCKEAAVLIEAVVQQHKTLLVVYIRLARLGLPPKEVDESINRAILRAKIQSQQGDSNAALTTIESFRDLNSRHASNIWLDQDLIAYQALFRLHQGDLTSAERLLGGGWEIDKNPFSAFVRASMLMNQNRNVAAEELLRHLPDRYPHSFYWVTILRARVQLSLALFNQQKVNQARQAMAEAARLAAPEFFVRPFLTSGSQTPALLSLVLRTEDLNPGTRSFVRDTLAMLGHAGGATSSREEPAPLAIAASISPREQEILQSLSIGLSNQEIANKYSISASTVKTHLENIFRKLDVSNRTQANAQAQALGLVQTLAKEL